MVSYIVNVSVKTNETEQQQVNYLPFTFVFTIGSVSGIGLVIFYTKRKKEARNKKDMSIIEERMYYQKNPQSTRYWVGKRVEGE